MQFQFIAAGETLVDRHLLRFSEHASNPRPAFMAVSEYVMRVMKRQFDQQGAGPSGRWAPLAASTVAQKARNNLDPRILHATLTMRNALTKKGDKNQRLIINNDWMVFGVTDDVHYLQYHQKGGGSLPQRRVFDLTKTVKTNMVKIIQRWIVEGKIERPRG